jgi:nucleoside phosphorylase
VEPEQRTLVLTALPAEADAILARATLDEHPVVVADGKRYYCGVFGDRRVIVAMSGIGMENAARTTEKALTHFGAAGARSPIRAVVFVGVAGGSGRTRIGDVAVPKRWTADRGATWREVDHDMLAAAALLDVRLESTGAIVDPASRVIGRLVRDMRIDLKRQPELHVGGDGDSHDYNNGTTFPAIPFGGAVFGPQPLAAPDFSARFTGNFFDAIGAFLRRGAIANIVGFIGDRPPEVDAVDQETAAAQRVADARAVPFIGVRGMSDGPGDPLRLAGFPVTFFAYKQIAANNAALVTEALVRSWGGAKG